MKTLIKLILISGLCPLFIICVSFLGNTTIHTPTPLKQINSDTIPVKIEMEQLSIGNMNVLFITDTALTTADIHSVLGKGYGEIMQFVQQNKLEPLKFMAKYHTYQPPWIMDIAVDVNEIPAVLSGRIRSEVQAGGHVLVAHMWGPYNEVGQAYRAIANWRSKNNLKARGAPFEVYLNDPSAVKDPSQIRTDVYMPIE